MRNPRYLLDTNIIIAVLNGEGGVLTRLQRGHESFLSVVTIGELLRGALGSQRVIANVAKVHALARSMAVLPCELTTAEHYARIKHNLRTKGRPLPDNDVWIAATAEQREMVLVTRDVHFSYIETLSTERW